MDSQHLRNEITKIGLRLQHSPPAQFWMTVGGLIFAVIFLIVGLSRTLEFHGLGLSRPRRAILSAMHIIGCLLLSAALAGRAVDFTNEYQIWVGSCLLSSLVLLFPAHIYIGLLRRVELRRRMELNQR